LCELLAAEPALAGVRAGLHHAQAHVRRESDPSAFARPQFDGETARAASLAAQLALHAHRGQVLATVAVAEAAATAGVDVTKLGDFSLRGIPDLVTIFELDVCAAEGARVEDPVCRIEVERDRAPARLRYDHVAYYFCSLECAADFARNPARYAFD
jgi:YHS domain-containing protein